MFRAQVLSILSLKNAASDGGVFTSEATDKR